MWDDCIREWSFNDISTNLILNDIANGSPVDTKFTVKSQLKLIKFFILISWWLNTFNYPLKFKKFIINNYEPLFSILVYGAEYKQTFQTSYL